MERAESAMADLRVTTATVATDVKHLLTSQAAWHESIESLRMSSAAAAVSGASLAASASAAAERHWPPAAKATVLAAVFGTLGVVLASLLA